jgi:hypothetical protein
MRIKVLTPAHYDLIMLKQPFNTDGGLNPVSTEKVRPPVLDIDNPSRALERIFSGFTDMKNL